MPDSQPEQSESSLLWEKISNLEAKLAERNSGVIGWVNKWGVLIGLGATILSIIGAAISISSSIRGLHPKPETKVFASEDKIVFQKFDHDSQRVTFKIDSIITNSGSADDLIVIQALIKVPDLPASDASSSYGGDFEVLDQNGRKLPRPFVLPKGSNLELNCSVSFNYSQRSAAAFEKDGMRHLTVIFDNGTKSPPSLDFCFDDVYTPDTHEFFAQECPRDF